MDYRKAHTPNKQNNKQKPQAATHKITATKTQEALKAWESCDFFHFSQILWALQIPSVSDFAWLRYFFPDSDGI